MTNITNQVFEYLQKNPEPGFEVSLIARDDITKTIKDFQTKILSDILKDTFKCNTGVIQKFQKWMSIQERLHDGCIEFMYCPCSMGVVIHATNSLTKSTIDLTEY